MNPGIGAAIGSTLGMVISIATGDWWWLGVFVGPCTGIGAAVQAWQKQADD